MRLLICVAFVCVAGFAMAAAAEDSPKVGALLEEWKDAARDRTIPVKIDYPPSITQPLPVVILSHGLGGSCEALAYLGQYLAAHGYIAVHLQHPGSDESLWKGLEPAEAMKAMKAGISVEQFMARVADVTFALDELTRRTADPSWALHDKLDLKRIAMAGHSFGAITTQAMCGQVYAGHKTFFDPRIKAGIALSPSPSNTLDAKAAFGEMAVPIFYWTGTQDDTPAFLGNLKAVQRRIPFDSSKRNDAYLVILTGANHMTFNGGLRKPPGDNAPSPADTAAWLDLIDRGCVAFLDKYLKEDAGQAKYLDEGGLAKDVGERGTVEMKKGEKK